jgi:hypothetical protein
MSIKINNFHLLNTFSDALVTISGVAPVIYACKGSSSPGSG